MLGGKVRVLVVDDHPLLRAGVAAVLNGKSDMTIVGEAGGRETVERFQALQPDVTVMDLQMPGMSGIVAICAIRLEVRLRESWCSPRSRVMFRHSGSRRARLLMCSRSGFAPISRTSSGRFTGA